MISAPTGDSQKVTGRIIAMVVSGPIPGKTPIAVPITQPNKHKPMFCQVSAMPNPIAILDRMSGMSERRPKRDLDAQCEHEDPRPPPPALRNLSSPKERHRRERRTDRDQQRADEPREITRFHRACGSGVEVASEPQAQQAERHVEAAGEKILARKYAAHRPAAPCRPPARASVPPDGLGRRGLFLPRLHQARLEENWIELGIVVPPALIGRLGVARLDDEAGLFCLGLEVGALQCR